MLLRDLLLGDDDEAMRQYCIDRLGVDPGGLKLCGLKQEVIMVRGKVRHLGFPYEADGANLIWLKNRLNEAGVFEVGRRYFDDKIGCPLHCFFLSLEETEEMIMRLWNDDELIQAKVARSKVSRTFAKIRPINQLSFLVAGGKWWE